VYTVWLGWPYLHAIVVRDAAVTSWLGLTNAPIAGYATNVLHPSERANEDGRIATIADSRADGADSARAQADVANARARVASQVAMIAAAQLALDQRAGHATEFASTFTRDLTVAVAGATKSLAVLRQQTELNRAEAVRTASLLRAGSSSQAAVDAANATLAALERQAADTQALLDRANTRLRAAERGVFLLEDGTDGNTAFQNLSDARLRLAQARETLTQLRAEQETAESTLAKTRSLDIVAPPRAMVWSLISSPGSPVQPGDPIATWVDCSVMLVDTPVSDVEAALLRKGAIANVVLEGERAVRRGSVLLTRGSAGTLGSHDLAALAKGRHSGVAQALVTLEPSADDVKECPIGRAAYVDFPDIGIFDLVLARLRLGRGAR
jgi:multidrug resistance efflux pump